MVIHAQSPVTFENGVDLSGKRVLVIEDGPTLTHGGMTFGAGAVAARAAGAVLVDARPHAVGRIRALFEQYPHVGPGAPGRRVQRRADRGPREDRRTRWTATT